MSEYRVIARRFRPKFFKEVVGQEAIISTLQNAIKNRRLAQAYLFCGSRGTGKTTIARLLARALNCQDLSPDFEPCGLCASCKEITSGNSLDVLEIDGASHRGIEDIRQINETVGYAASGTYKIYIIDEVHMLTKEAFNALLKTLEEPPAKVKFFFATTEPHKIPSTILSRCQRFNLGRIPLNQMVNKLRSIGKQLEAEIDEEALHLIAKRAEGGMRDAESLFDQILAFEEGRITTQSVASILGMMPQETYFEIDRAGKEGNFIKAFEIAQRVFAEGKDLSFFIEGLIDHLRQILLFKLPGDKSTLVIGTEAEKKQYEEVCGFYTQEQCLDLIEYLLQAQSQLRSTAFGKAFLEIILLHIIRSHSRLSIEQLVHRLSELESVIQEPPKEREKEVKVPNTPKAILPSPALQIEIPSQKVEHSFNDSISEDPTPTPADLGRKNTKQPAPPPISKLSVELAQPMHKYDTLFHFAAIELEGKLQKK